jgi:ribosome-associated translation inhibitor RaiA
MSISFVDQDSLLDGELREMAERRLLFALSRYDSRIAKVEMVVCNEGTTRSRGPSSDHGKVCRVSVTFNRDVELQISDRDDDLAQCISRVADRVGREVARAVEQKLQFDRSRARI